jgi:hypothetical protein
MAFPLIGKFLLDPYREKPAALTRRTDMESGPPKQARKARRRIVQRPCAYRFTQVEYTTFKAWVDSEGAEIWFNWTDPYDGSTKPARLVLGQYEGQPVKTEDGAALEWVVNFTLETFE